DAAPHLVEQPIALDELALALRKKHEHVHDLRLHVLLAAGAFDDPGQRFDLERADTKTPSKLFVHRGMRHPDERAGPAPRGSESGRRRNAMTRSMVAAAIVRGNRPVAA